LNVAENSVKHTSETASYVLEMLNYNKGINEISWNVYVSRHKR